MPKQRQRGLQDGVDDASSDKSELALLMRENAEALFLDLAGGAYSRAFNPGCPPKRRQRSHKAIQGLREHHGHPAKDVDQRKDAKMDWNRVEGNWKQVKGKVKEQWGKLTDDDLTTINGRRDQLEGKIQERYGYAKDQVRQEVDDWYSAQDWSS